MTATTTTQTPPAAAADFLCRGANAGSAPLTGPAPPGWRGSGVVGGRPIRTPESEGMARVAAGGNSPRIEPPPPSRAPARPSPPRERPFGLLALHFPAKPHHPPFSG